MDRYSSVPTPSRFRSFAAFALGSCLTIATGTINAQTNAFSPSFRKFVNGYCADCHNAEKKKGKLDLLSLFDNEFSTHQDTWEEVAWMLREREMPPPDEEDLKRPSESEYQTAIQWLDPVLQSSKRTSPDEPDPDAFQTHQATVKKYCVNCHNDEDKKGEFSFESFLQLPVTDHAEHWEKVITRIQARQMPPPGRKRPSESTYKAMLSSLTGTLDQYAASHPRPGRVDTFRRLTRTEYQNAIRDLLSVDIDTATLLPQDEESHGFDNVTVGSLSASLVDRYISAAQKISRLAIGTGLKRPGGHTHRIPPDYTQEKHVDGLPLGTRGGALIDYTFPQDGEYEIVVHLSRDRNEHVEGLNGSHQMEVLIDRNLVKTFTVSRKGHQGHSSVDKHLNVRTFVKAGPRKVGVTFVQKSYSLLENKRQPFEAHFNLHRHPRLSPAIYEVSITGPFESTGPGDTPSRRNIFFRNRDKKADDESAAMVILSDLMTRAFRRPIEDHEFAKPMRFFREGRAQAGFEAGIERALQSILVSPEFLFRIEREPEAVKPGAAYRISDLELASRLSFFLWSSVPDDALLEAAIQGRLSQTAELDGQVTRMLQDSRALNLVHNFASQWLHLRNLDSVTPDLRLYPDFDDNLRQAFRKETSLFLQSIIQEDRSVLDLLSADYTYLNERLAHHYDIPGVFGSRFRRVHLTPEQHRGGLLRQGSILTVTSYATRTSPVIRGNWVLENIIGTPPPPPPPNVPALEDNKVDASLSMRERLAAHRENPACASCHNLMDPVGFALENFDAVGRWRDFENGDDIDVAGGLPDGRVFEGVENLENGLLDRPELFVHTITKKLMTFALGRGMETHDAPAIRRIVREAEEQEYRFSAIIRGITQSVPFQMRTKSNTD